MSKVGVIRTAINRLESYRESKRREVQHYQEDALAESCEDVLRYVQHQTPPGNPIHDMIREYFEGRDENGEPNKAFLRRYLEDVKQ